MQYEGFFVEHLVIPRDGHEIRKINIDGAISCATLKRDPDTHAGANGFFRRGGAASRNAGEGYMVSGRMGARRNRVQMIKVSRRGDNVGMGAERREIACSSPAQAVIARMEARANGNLTNLEFDTTMTDSSIFRRKMQALRYKVSCASGRQMFPEGRMVCVFLSCGTYMQLLRILNVSGDGLGRGLNLYANMKAWMDLDDSEPGDQRLDDNLATSTNTIRTLRVLLAGPRGFCAGVDRAIRVVEEALRRYGAPVYVRHEIVHNRTVVESLEKKGAIFVEELDEVPADAHVVFSAHGVPKTVPAEAERRNLLYLDATCPLVSKVHREAERHFAGGSEDSRHILMIGHAGHPEVVGTMGQLPLGAVTLINDADEARRVEPKDPTRLAFITQTTLSVDDTSEIVSILRERFPLIEGPKKEDICYATTNRQEAVKAIAPESDLVIVIGSPNSSNSQRLREVAERSGAKAALLVPKLDALDWSVLDDVETVGITAGASAPESLVQEIVDAMFKRFRLNIEERIVKEENVTFRLPSPWGICFNAASPGGVIFP